jgi:Amt family ammonium transporter
MTQISASSGALAWTLIEVIKFRKVSSLGFVSGILAGLVVITPAAGVVHPLGAMILGGISAIACYLALHAKDKFGYDDSLDCFGIHGVGSGLGVLLLCFFLRKNWVADQAADWSVMGQFIAQLKGMGATIVFAGVVTLIICYIVDKTCGLRLSPEDEKAGLDHSQHGEHGYGLLNLN